MKKLLVAVAMVLIFCGAALAESFCEMNFGIPFFTDRNVAEAEMTRNHGAQTMKIDEFTVFQLNTDISATLFFKQGKFVAASLMTAHHMNENTIKLMMDMFVTTKKDIDSKNEYRFLREVQFTFGSLITKGFLYECKSNKMEKMLLYISRDKETNVIGVCLHSYLSGFGLKEF